MKGVPKYFNTKQDVENSLLEDKEATISILRKLYENRFIWKDVGIIENEGINDNIHKVVEMRDNLDNNITHRHQLILIEDPMSYIFRLGYNKKELEELLGE